MVKKFIYGFILLGLSLADSHGQGKTLAVQFSYRDGAYIHFADRSISSVTPLNNVTSIRVSRDQGSGFRIIGVVERAGSLQEFKRICGEETWSQLKTMKKFSADDVAWQFILTHPLLTDYGTLSFNMAFRRAMGTAMLDADAQKLPAGKQWKYRAEWLDASGTITYTAEATINGGEAKLQLAKARQLYAEASDSAANMQWYIPLSSKPDVIIMADVYRQDGGKGSFKKQSSPLLAVNRNDSLIFSFQQAITAQTLYRYYILPMDNLGNLSQNSDTINVISYNFRDLPTLDNVTAKDSLNSILLRWSALEDSPHLVGIEIQRSRDVRGNYVVIDTVAPSKNSFHDSQVLPEIAYYYRLRVLTLKGKQKIDGYGGYATAVVHNKQKKPDPPYALTGNVSNGNIKLQWQAVSDPDLYGYFVYRSPSNKATFQVISPSIQGTEFTDSSAVNARTQYVYAVKAVNNNSLESEFSNFITMRQDLLTLPLAPAGINAMLQNRTVVLTWNSVAKMDHAIAGYNLYRREFQAANQFDQTLPAAAQAATLKFTLLNKSLIVPAYTEDRSIERGKTYEYAVASVDVFGQESTYSPFAKVAIQFPSRLITNCTIRKVTGGVQLEWDPAMAEDGGTISIYRKRAGEQAFQKLQTVTAQQNSYVDKLTSRGNVYVYLIRAEQEGQIVAKSEEKSIMH